MSRAKFGEKKQGLKREPRITGTKHWSTSTNTNDCVALRESLKLGSEYPSHVLESAMGKEGDIELNKLATRIVNLFEREDALKSAKPRMNNTSVEVCVPKAFKDQQVVDIRQLKRDLFKERNMKKHRWLNSIIASVGMGKSRFIDEVVDCLNRDHDNINSDNIIVPIAMSYNTITFKYAAQTSDAVADACARLYVSYYCDVDRVYANIAKKYSSNKWTAKFGEEMGRLVNSVYDIITADGRSSTECLHDLVYIIRNDVKSIRNNCTNPRLLLLIDETSKASSSIEAVRAFVRDICRALDVYDPESKLFDVMFSALSYSLLSTATENYARHINYFDIELFDETKSKMLAVTDVSDKIKTEYAREINALAYLTGGHARSVAALNKRLMHPEDYAISPLLSGSALVSHVATLVEETVWGYMIPTLSDTLLRLLLVKTDVSVDADTIKKLSKMENKPLEELYEGVIKGHIYMKTTSKDKDSNDGAVKYSVFYPPFSLANTIVKRGKMLYSDFWHLSQACLLSKYRIVTEFGLEDNIIMKDDATTKLRERFLMHLDIGLRSCFQDDKYITPRDFYCTDMGHKQPTWTMRAPYLYSECNIINVPNDSKKGSFPSEHHHVQHLMERLGCTEKEVADTLCNDNYVLCPEEDELNNKGHEYVVCCKAEDNSNKFILVDVSSYSNTNYYERNTTAFEDKLMKACRNDAVSKKVWKSLGVDIDRDITTVLMIHSAFPQQYKDMNMVSQYLIEHNVPSTLIMGKNEIYKFTRRMKPFLLMIEDEVNVNNSKPDEEDKSATERVVETTTKE